MQARKPRERPHTSFNFMTRIPSTYCKLQIYRIYHMLTGDREVEESNWIIVEDIGVYHHLYSFVYSKNFHLMMVL